MGRSGTDERVERFSFLFRFFSLRMWTRFDGFKAFYQRCVVVIFLPIPRYGVGWGEGWSGRRLVIFWFYLDLVAAYGGHGGDKGGEGEIGVESPRETGVT